MTEPISVPSEKPMPRRIYKHERFDDTGGRQVTVQTQVAPQEFPVSVVYTGVCQPPPLGGHIFQFVINATSIEDAFLKWDQVFKDAWLKFTTDQRKKLIIPGK